MTADRRESKQTRDALAREDSLWTVLRDSRRRLRYGSIKAAGRLNSAIEAVRELAEADLEYDNAREQLRYAEGLNPAVCNSGGHPYDHPAVMRVRAASERRRLAQVPFRRPT